MQKRQLHQAPTFGGRRRRRRSSSGWSSLSADLVVLLLQRLNLQDYVRSGAVCRWWNTIVSSKPCPPAPNLMWEYMDPKDVHHQPSSGTNNNTLTFYCPTEKRFYNFPSPCGAVLVTELCFGNYRGWLLMATATGCPPDSQRRHILYNPISGAQVKNIPPLPENTFNITVMQLQPFVVVAGWEDLKENRGGAVRIWRSSCCRDEESAGWSQILHDKSPDFWYESIISYKGSLYAVTNAAELRLIEFINNPHQDYSPQVRTVIGPLFTTTLTGVIPSPPCRIVLPNLGVMGGEVSPKSTVNPVLQAPRRKFLDEGKLRMSVRSSSARAANNQISGRLFADSAAQQSARLTGDTAANANSNIVHVGGNGINHSSSKLLGGFSSSAKICSATLRSVTMGKGQNGIAEIVDEGRQSEASDDLNLGNTSSTSVMIALTDDRLTESNRADVQMGGASTSGSQVPSGVTQLLCLLKTLGEAYRLFCLYKCQDALEAFNRLPHQQFNTGWVLSQVGKTYFEMVDLFEADRTFDLAHHASPYSLEGMDIYSTVLYHLKEELKLRYLAQELIATDRLSPQHLKEELKLRYLAQELIATDRLSPQAWCAMGNCYSLLKDHETALKSFQRAVQLDSKFSYAHTLCGHEYVVLEDFENGIKSYQCALRVDPRHYNAWYGLGMVYLRQEKYEFAEHHFRKAFLINKHSSVLMCYLGIALHSLKRDEEALEVMDKAILADKKNPLPMYQKGNILLSMERFGEALRVLEQLKESVPRESSVFALMGKIYKRLGMHDKAMFHFGVALDLKPSAADVATIKSAIEKLNVPDELEEM